MTNWINVNERLPDTEDMYWVVRKGTKRPKLEEFYIRGAHTWWTCDSEAVRANWDDAKRLKDTNPVTHWQPYVIPEMPRSK